MRTPFIALSCLLVIGAQASDCPDGFNQIGKKCYWITKEPVNWFYADMSCRTRGSQLLTFDNDAEFQAISDYLSSTGCNKHELGCSFWTSATRSVKSRFLWQTNGKPVDHRYFLPGQPNNKEKNELCAELKFERKIKRFGLNDINCGRDNRISYICETETQIVPLVPPVPTCPPIPTCSTIPTCPPVPTCPLVPTCPPVLEPVPTVPSRDIQWCACTLQNNTVITGSPEELC